MRETWHLIDSGRCDPAFNMALDEALMMMAADPGHALLRFYAWTKPTATFGYFQRIAEVEQATLLRPLVRRPTGGGLVPHDTDWTYSVVIPAGHEWHRMKAEQSYRRMHKWIRAAFQHMGVATDLALDSRKPVPGQCFEGHEVHDVLWQEHKIAGAAQRRTRTSLLIQGSVQPPPIELERNAWQQAMCEVADATWTASEPDRTVMHRASSLAREKYSTDSYNRKR